MDNPLVMPRESGASSSRQPCDNRTDWGYWIAHLRGR